MGEGMGPCFAKEGREKGGERAGEMGAGAPHWPRQDGRSGGGRANLKCEQTAGQAAGTLAELAGREQALRGVLAWLRLERLDGGGDGQDDR